MICNKTDIYVAVKEGCFVLLTFDPRTFHETLVRIVYAAEKEPETRPGLTPSHMSLCLPSHWVAVWLTYSEIPSSKLIAEHCGVSWLMRGCFSHV